MEVTLQDITTELLSEKRDKIPIVPVRKWMESNDIEVLGAVSALLDDPTLRERVDPSLNFNDYRTFYLRYFDRCIREDPDGEWSDSRYLAAHGLVSWFNRIWKDSKIPRSALSELKSLLEQLYRNGDRQVRCCIVTGALEHLFVNREVKRFFADWKADETLRSGYDEAVGYSKELRGKKYGHL